MNKRIHHLLALSGLDRQLGFALRQASVAVWADVRRALEPAGLKPQSYAILLIIDTSPGCKQQDVADALGIQRANLVAVIDGLVTKGLVARGVNPDDRRSYALTLTDDGRALLARGRAAHREHERRIDAALEAGDTETLFATAARLAKL